MPKIVDHEQVRADIVARAVELFAEQGFGGLGIRGLARAVGMAKSSIYYYFPTKEALIEAVIDAVVAQDMASLEQSVAGAGTLEDRLARAITWTTANEDRLATQIRILNEAAREEIWTDDGSVTQSYVKGMGRVLGLNATAARAYYFHVLGVVLQRMVDAKRTSLRRELGTLNDLLLGSRSAVEGKLGPVAARTSPAPQRAAKKATAGKAARPATRKPAKKATAAARKKSASKKTASKKTASRKTAGKKATAGKSPGKAATRKRAARRR